MADKSMLKLPRYERKLRSITIRTLNRTEPITMHQEAVSEEEEEVALEVEEVEVEEEEEVSSEDEVVIEDASMRKEKKIQTLIIIILSLRKVLTNLEEDVSEEVHQVKIKDKILEPSPRLPCLLPTFLSLWMMLVLPKSSPITPSSSSQLMLFKREMDEAKDLALLNSIAKTTNKRPFKH